MVIQDQSQRPSFGMNYVYGYIMQDVAAISRAIQETNPCTQPVFFLTWGKRDGDSQNCHIHESFCSFEGIQVGTCGTILGSTCLPSRTA